MIALDGNSDLMQAQELSPGLVIDRTFQLYIEYNQKDEKTLGRIAGVIPAN